MINLYSVIIKIYKEIMAESLTRIFLGFAPKYAKMHEDFFGNMLDNKGEKETLYTWEKS